MEPKVATLQCCQRQPRNLAKGRKSIEEPLVESGLSPESSLPSTCSNSGDPCRQINQHGDAHGESAGSPGSIQVHCGEGDDSVTLSTGTGTAPADRQQPVRAHKQKQTLPRNAFVVDLCSDSESEDEVEVVAGLNKCTKNHLVANRNDKGGLLEPITDFGTRLADDSDDEMEVEAGPRHRMESHLAGSRNRKIEAAVGQGNVSDSDSRVGNDSERNRLVAEASSDRETDEEDDIVQYLSPINEALPQPRYSAARRRQRCNLACGGCNEKIVDHHMWMLLKNEVIQTQFDKHVICIVCWPIESYLIPPPLPPGAGREAGYKLGSKHEYEVFQPKDVPLYDQRVG